MNLTHTLIVIFVGSFIIQYFLMPPIMVNSIEDITNNIGKAYSVTIMSLSMIIFEIMIHDHKYGVMSLNLYAILFSLLSLFIYLYRNQVAIDDKQYLEGMIEHHSMALLTSEEILKKTNDYNIAKIAKNIIQTQTDEIRDMREILKK